LYKKYCGIQQNERPASEVWAARVCARNEQRHSLGVFIQTQRMMLRTKCLIVN